MDIQNILEMIKLVGAAAGAILSIIALITALSKKPKQWLINTVKEATKDEFEKIHNFIEKTEATDLNTLRHEITLIYEKYRDKKEIPMRLRENLCILYEDYSKRGGNSYVKTIYEEMMDWRVI
jgi:hypothetical protein